MAWDLASHLEWWTASSTLPNESESGDVHVVHGETNRIVIAVIDGLGHGKQAAQAAMQAKVTLLAYANESVIAIVKRCHEALRETRGVVMSLASLDLVDGTMSWLAIGNVAAVLIRSERDADPSHEEILTRGGIIGLRLPLLRATVMSISPGDLIVFATDGIEPAFLEHVLRPQPPQHLAQRVLADHGKDTDDALVLVARFLGGVQPS